LGYTVDTCPVRNSGDAVCGIRFIEVISNGMKTKLKTLVILGVLVVVVPFFGIWSSWIKGFLVVIGLLVIWFALSLRSLLPREEADGTTPVYTENGKRQ
jgi:hypothetical protein